MSRRPHDLPFPWSMQWDHARKPFSASQQLWWLLAALAILALAVGMAARQKSEG